MNNELKEMIINYQDTKNQDIRQQAFENIKEIVFDMVRKVDDIITDISLEGSIIDKASKKAKMEAQDASDRVGMLLGPISNSFYYKGEMIDFFDITIVGDTVLLHQNVDNEFVMDWCIDIDSLQSENHCFENEIRYIIDEIHLNLTAIEYYIAMVKGNSFTKQQDSDNEAKLKELESQQIFYKELFIYFNELL